MADEREFYSVPEFAKRLGVSRIAVFKKVKKGQIRAIRIGRNWAIPSDELGVLLECKNIASENTMKAQNKILEGKSVPNIEIDAMDDLGWD
ncbi:MAG: excisionase family DNA-binding protein [Elusimicrobia bacterium]|nr:excisionase family DNA-binding protein [Elusimicrobiota bacterium]